MYHTDTTSKICAPVFEESRIRVHVVWVPVPALNVHSWYLHDIRHTTATQLLLSPAFPIQDVDNFVPPVRGSSHVRCVADPFLCPAKSIDSQRLNSRDVLRNEVVTISVLRVVYITISWMQQVTFINVVDADGIERLAVIVVKQPPAVRALLYREE